MRYIRTIAFENEEIIDVSNWEYEDGTYSTEKYTIFNSEIIKQADTIEELCDEFVITNWKEKGKPVLCKYRKDKNALCYIDEYGFNASFIPDLLKSNCEIYGAIWTDKGLIYVAKMNEKGELELL